MSLWFARPYLYGKDFLHLHGDLLYHPAILQRALHGKGTCILYDSSKCDKEAMKVQVKNGFYVRSDKTLITRHSNGEFLGINKFDAETGARLFDEAEVLIDQGKFQAYDTEALNKLSRTLKLPATNISGLPWIEIDSPKDLENARHNILPQIKENLLLK